MTEPDIHTAIVVNRLMLDQSEYCDWADRVIEALDDDRVMWKRATHRLTVFAILLLGFTLYCTVARIVNG